MKPDRFACQASLFRALTNYGSSQRPRSLYGPCTPHPTGGFQIVGQNWPNRLASSGSLAPTGDKAVNPFWPSLHSETRGRPNSNPSSTGNPLLSKPCQCECARPVSDRRLLRRAIRKLLRNCCSAGYGRPLAKLTLQGKGRPQRATTALCPF